MGEIGPKELQRRQLRESREAKWTSAKLPIAKIAGGKSSASSAMLATAGVVAAPVVGNARRGRPRIGETPAPKVEPWKELKMSRRTWYRRQKERRG